MSYAIVVPNPVRNEITSWELPPAVEDELYRRLEEDLKDGHEKTCLRLAAPAPTFIHRIDLDDCNNPLIIHCCTFYLTYGRQDNALYLMNCFHEIKETWAEDSDDRDYDSEIP